MKSGNGFGLTVVSVEEEDWDETGIDIEHYERSLRALGIGDEQIGHEVKVAYESARDPSGKQFLRYDDDQVAQAASRVRTAIYNFIAGRVERVVGEPWRHPVKIPLFYLSAPAVDLSKVTYETETTVEKGVNWSVKVVGVGWSRKRTVKLKEKDQFFVSAGNEIMIFWPATLLVTRIETFQRGERIGEGIRAELEPPPVGQHYSVPTSQELVPQDMRSTPSTTEIMGVYPLENAEAGKIAHKQTREIATPSEGGIKGSIDLSVFKTGIEAETFVKRDSKVSIEIELPGGIHYEMCRPSERDGMCWRTTTPPRSESASGRASGAKPR